MLSARAAFVFVKKLRGSRHQGDSFVCAQRMAVYAHRKSVAECITVAAANGSHHHYVQNVAFEGVLALAAIGFVAPTTGADVFRGNSKAAGDWFL
jgi:hypothetical protein